MKNIYITLVLIILFTFLNFPVHGEIIYPEYDGNKVIDLSGKFKNSYLNKINGEISNSDFETRIVFIKSEGKLNLGFYAPKLFEKWKMSEDSILVVVDPYLNKTGYALGTNVRELMKKRQKVFVEQDSKKEGKEIIDYDNIVSAIKDKFSLEEIIAKEKQNAIKDKVKTKVTYSENNTFNNNIPSTDININWKIILPIILFFVLLGLGIFLFNRNKSYKRSLELKTNYTFDADIQKQEITQILEKIVKDIEKAKSYNGTTLNEYSKHIENLKKVKKEADKFLIKFDAEFSEVDMDGLGAIRDLLDEGNLLLDNLKSLHKESVKQRKDIKVIVEKSEMSLSDVRVNIEQSKITLEELKTLYLFPLEYSEKKIENIERIMENAKSILLQNDPYEFRNRLSNIHNEIKILKRDFDIIPHLYKQLKEDLPLNIDSYLEESLLDPVPKSKLRAEVHDIRNNALILLSKGELEKTETLVKSIFEKMNKIKTTIN